MAEKRKRKNLDEHWVKTRILSYLYNKGSDGANLHNIQIYAVHTTQEHKRIKGFVMDLVSKGFVEEKDMSHVARGARTYNITDDGRQYVQNPLIKRFWGLDNDGLSHP